MPASDLTYWLAFLKLERAATEKAHLEAVARGGVQQARAKGFGPKGRR